MEETRVRETDSEHVAALGLVLDKLPPIEVVKLADSFGVVSGYHRVEAYRQAGKATVPAVVVDLPIEEWHPYTVAANLTHGLRLTLKDRRHAAVRMLEDSPRLSDRDIGRRCGLDGKTVGVIRRSLEEDSCGIPQSVKSHAELVGEDDGPNSIAEFAEAIEAAAPTGENPVRSHRKGDDPFKTFRLTATVADRMADTLSFFVTMLPAARRAGQLPPDLEEKLLISADRCEESINWLRAYLRGEDVTAEVTAFLRDEVAE